MTFPTSCRAAARLLPVLALLLASGCKKELDTYYTEVGPQLPTFLANALGTATKYAPGEVVQFQLQFAPQSAALREIRILQKVEPGRDSTLVQTIPYQPAFSRLRQADTLLVNYVVPAGQNKANVRVDAVVVSDNGQTKTRTFSFRLAEPTPTVRLNATSNLTAPGTSTPVPGDVVRFPVVLNEGGITSATALTTAGTLYKDLDSLVTYVRVGSGPERRALKASKLTATGAQTIVNVDVTLPAGSSGQPVVYRFEAKARYQDKNPPAAASTKSATVTAAAITPGTATALAAVRPVTLTYTGSTGGDLASYDLTTFASVPAAEPVASKDVSISSIATNAVQLKALNTTRFVRSTSAAYGAATLNSIRQIYQTAAATAQVAQLDNVAAGDVVVARLRGADQYAIFTITSINRTATSVTLTLDVKAP